MKIRTDFVTNSSSSCWIIFTSFLTAAGFVTGLAGGMTKRSLPDQDVAQDNDSVTTGSSQNGSVLDGSKVLDGAEAKDWLRDHGLMDGNTLTDGFWDSLYDAELTDSPLQGMAGEWHSDNRKAEVGDISIIIREPGPGQPANAAIEELTAEDLAAVDRVIEHKVSQPAAIRAAPDSSVPADIRPMYGISVAPGSPAPADIRPMYGINVAPGSPTPVEIRPMYGISVAPGNLAPADIRPMYGISVAPGSPPSVDIRPMYGISVAPGSLAPIDIRPMYGISVAPGSPPPAEIRPMYGVSPHLPGPADI